MKLPSWLGGRPEDGDPLLIEAVSNHVQNWIGEFTVMHEKQSNKVHLDIYCVAPKEERPYRTLVTSGMAELPMKAPRQMKDCTHAELVMHLPPDWPMDRETMTPESIWPIAILKSMARYPHKSGAWLWYGHSVPFEDFHGLKGRFDSAMLYLPLLLDPKGARLTLKDGRAIMFWSMIMLYPEEVEFKRKEGADRLIELAEEKGKLEELFVLTPGRASLIG